MGNDIEKVEVPVEVMAPTNEDFVYARMEGNPLAAAQQMGKMIAESGLFGIKTTPQGMVLALEAMHQQRPVMELARRYHVIEGKLSMRADAMQAEFQADGGLVKWLETSTEVCSAEFSHPKHAPEAVPVTVTFKEMKESGVAVGSGKAIKANWKKFPRQMLRARCISEGVRMVHPGIVVGVYTPEEVTDFKPARATATVKRKAKKKAEPKAEKTPHEKAVAGVYAGLIKLGAEKEEMEEFVNAPWQRWGDDDVRVLTEIGMAVKAGDVDIHEALAVPREAMGDEEDPGEPPEEGE